MHDLIDWLFSPPPPPTFKQKVREAAIVFGFWFIVGLAISGVLDMLIRILMILL